MKTYIALLRGINVSGQKKIIMAELREMFVKLEFNAVETYIQSGNIVFKSNSNSTEIIAEKIKKGISNSFGFEVPTLVKSREELKSIFDANPFTDASDIENKRVYFALLKNPPQIEFAEKFKNEVYPGEQFIITDECVYLNYTLGAGKAKLNNNLIERKLKVSATSRNYRTMTKLLEMSK